MTFPGLPKSAAEVLLNSIQMNFDEIYQDLVFGFFPEYNPDDNEPVPEYIEIQVEDTRKVGGMIAHGILRLVGIEDFRTRIPEVKAPTLIIHGGKDKLTFPDAGKWIFENLGSEKKKFILYEEAGHVPFVGPTGEKFNLDVEEFLKSKK